MLCYHFTISSLLSSPEITSCKQIKEIWNKQEYKICDVGVIRIPKFIPIGRKCNYRTLNINNMNFRYRKIPLWNKHRTQFTRLNGGLNNKNLFHKIYLNCDVESQIPAFTTSFRTSMHYTCTEYQKERSSLDFPSI